MPAASAAAIGLRDDAQHWREHAEQIRARALSTRMVVAGWCCCTSQRPMKRSRDAQQEVLLAPLKNNGKYLALRHESSFLTWYPRSRLSRSSPP